MQLEIPEEVECPYCMAKFTSFFDTSVPHQEYTEDCQICCRPIVFDLICEPGAVISIDLKPE